MPTSRDPRFTDPKYLAREKEVRKAERQTRIDAGRVTRTHVTCECSDPGCPAHSGKSECERISVTTVYRSDMEDRTGTRMCRACMEDAMESGVFYTK